MVCSTGGERYYSGGGGTLLKVGVSFHYKNKFSSGEPQSLIGACPACPLLLLPMIQNWSHIARSKANNN